MASTRVPALTVISLVSALALTACTPVPPGAADSSAAPGSGGSSAGSTGVDDDGRTAVTAVNTAEASAGGRAFELERDDDEWQVHVAVGDRELEVRVASDGTTVQSTTDDDGIDADERAALDAAVTTLADAVRIATTRNPGGERLDEVQLDDRDGAWVWEVEVSGGTTVRISAADGSIV